MVVHVCCLSLGSSPATLSVVRDLEFAATEDQHCWWGIELTPTHAIKVILNAGLDPKAANPTERPMAHPNANLFRYCVFCLGFRVFSSCAFSVGEWAREPFP